MFVRSPSATSPSGRVAASFATGALSPVSAASCTSSVAEATMRPSAGTTSPASSNTMSPGTRSIDSICLDAAGAPHPCVGHLQLRERVDARPRLELLARAHDDVERHEQRDEDAGRDLPDREARDRDDRQHDVHRVRQLAERDRPQMLGGGSVVSWFGPYSASRRVASSASSPGRGRPPTGPRASSGDERVPRGCLGILLNVLMSAPARATVRPDPASAECPPLCVVVVASS